MNTQRLFIPFFALLLLLPQFAAAQQDCRCCTKQAEGQALFDKKQYQAAIDKWKYAAGLSDKDKCPNLSSLISKAQQRVRERDEAAAQARRDKEKREAADARQRRADEAWSYIRLATNPEPFDQFLRDYPDSQQAPEARRLRDKYKPPPPQPREKESSTTQKVEPSTAVASFLVKIPGGTFSMGDLFGEGSDDERPTHNVTLSDFYLSKYEVSFDEFDAFCSATGREKPSDSGWGRGKRPAINVDWYDAIEYCNWLSTQHGLRAVYSIDKTTKDPNNKNTNDSKKWSVKTDWTANGYRLPTEAEWEYAARAVTVSGNARGGGKVRFGNGRDVIDPSEINFDASSAYKKPYSVVGEYRQQTVAVDALSANAFGLKNMSGNVWEWCWDWYDGELYKNTEGSRDPKGGTSGEYRVLRGGSWIDFPEDCRASSRSFCRPIFRNLLIGFRVARHL